MSTNPDLYKPSPSSLDLHRDGVLSYSTGEEDGCGTANISYHTYADAVSFAGSTACNQTFAVVIAKPPPNNGTITQFPNQGIVGFSRTFASATQLDAIPFFQTLCNEGSVRECKFGLALGTDGTSTQISGATDRKIYVGHLVTVDADPNEVVAFDGAITANGITTLTGATIISDSSTANVSSTYTVYSSFVLTEFRSSVLQATSVSSSTSSELKMSGRTSQVARRSSSATTLAMPLQRLAFHPAVARDLSTSSPRRLSKRTMAITTALQSSQASICRR